MIAATGEFVESVVTSFENNRCGDAVLGLEPERFDQHAVTRHVVVGIVADLHVIHLEVTRVNALVFVVQQVLHHFEHAHARRH